MMTLFLLTLASVEKVEAGQAFNNCLISHDFDTTSYNALLNYPFDSNSVISNNEVLILCCNDYQCSPFSLNCPSHNSVVTAFFCSRISQTTFCSDVSGTCAGIVGNTIITSNTTSGYGIACAESEIKSA